MAAMVDPSFRGLVGQPCGATERRGGRRRAARRSRRRTTRASAGERNARRSSVQAAPGFPARPGSRHQHTQGTSAMAASGWPGPTS
jgi:hypothetical protein